VGNATASRGLEVAVANLQEYCNGQYFTKKHVQINFPLKMKKYSLHEFFMFIQSNKLNNQGNKGYTYFLLKLL